MIIVPSTPPLNVSVIAINSTSIFVSWKPPIVTDQNGVIVSYNISVVDLQDNNITSDLVMDSTNTTITGKVLVGTFIGHYWCSLHTLNSNVPQIDRVFVFRKADILHVQIKCKKVFIN